MEAKRKGPGRHPHAPDEKSKKQVATMTGFGLTQAQIAAIVGISEDTLQKYYQEEIEKGVARANMQVANNLFSIATSKGSGAVAAAIFWMKTRARWRETDRIEVSGPDGGPIQTETKSLDVSRLSRDEREALKRTLLIALGEGEV